jgi:hypothetical protein
MVKLFRLLLRLKSLHTAYSDMNISRLALSKHKMMGKIAAYDDTRYRFQPSHCDTKVYKQMSISSSFKAY